MRRTTLSVCGLTLIGAADWSAATGFYVPQQTAYGAGRANAGNVAMAAEASTVFSNPAGMTRLEGAEVVWGLNIVTPSDRFDNRGTTLSTPGTGGTPSAVAGGRGSDPGSPTPVASLFYVHPIADRWRFGIGIAAPFGLRLEYDSDWFGRYDSIEAELITIDVAPSLAYRMSDALSLGAGLNVQYADTTLTSAVPDTLAPNAVTASTDGRSELTGDDVTVGFNLGLLWNAAPGTRIGLHYRSAMEHDIEGHNKISGLTGALASANGRFGVSSKLKLPDVLSAGFAHELTDRTTLVGEAQWFGWSRFDELRIVYDNGAPDVVLPQGYRDTYTVSAGAEHRWRDDLTLRAGIQYDRTPTVDRYRDTSLPDGDRIWTAVGLSYRPLRRLELSVSYQHVFFDDPQIDHTREVFAGSPAAATVRTRARVEASVDTLSLAIRYAL